MQRQRELLEEQRRLSAVLNETMLEGEMMKRTNKMKKEELTIEEIEQKTNKAKAQKEFEEFTKPAAPPPELAQKTARGRSPKMKARDDAQKRYEREIARIEAMRGRTAEAKADLKKAAAKDLEVELQNIDKMP